MQSEAQICLFIAKLWTDSNLLLETFLWCKSEKSLTIQWLVELLWNNTTQKTAASKKRGSIVSACQGPFQHFHLFRSYTGLFRKVKVVLKLIFLLKGFPISHRKVKHTHSSTVHLKLFLTVCLRKGKQTRIDTVSASLFPSETALNFKAESLLPFVLLIISNLPGLCQWCGECFAIGEGFRGYV